MFEVYFSYEPREIVLVDWKNTEDVSYNGGKLMKAYETFIYGEYTDWKWIRSFYPNPLSDTRASYNGKIEISDMRDSISKLFLQNYNEE